MAGLRAWLRSARPLAHANIAPPIVLGQALAYAATGRFEWRAALLAHAIGVVDHLAIVWWNDLADVEGDRLHPSPTPFSGGSRVLVDGEMSEATLRRAARGALGLLAALGVLGALAFSPALAVLVPAAMALLWAYSGAPLRSHRGGGEWLQGLGVGVVLPAIGAAAQGVVLRPEWLVPSFVLAVAGHWVTSVPDEEADRLAEKKTLAVRRGGLVVRRLALGTTALGAILGALLLPGSDGARGVVLAAVVVAAVPAIAVHRAAAPSDRRRCLAYVVSLGAAGTTALLGWSIAAVS